VSSYNITLTSLKTHRDPLRSTWTILDYTQNGALKNNLYSKIAMKFGLQPHKEIPLHLLFTVLLFSTVPHVTGDLYTPSLTDIAKSFNTPLAKANPRSVKTNIA
jgi:hypothetical protein